MKIFWLIYFRTNCGQNFNTNFGQNFSKNSGQNFNNFGYNLNKIFNKILAKLNSLPENIAKVFLLLWLKSNKNPAKNLVSI